MTEQEERDLQVHEAWGIRIAHEPSMNSVRLASYESKRAFGRKGDKAEVIVSRAEPAPYDARIPQCKIIPMTR